MNLLLRLFLILLVFPANLMAASFHWVDYDGFHSVDQVTKVPLANRLELPMVKNQISFPFTEEEDSDGAMYAWFVLNQSGLKAIYIKTEDIPKSSFYSKVEQPKPGDIAWWKNFVAVVNKPDFLMRAHAEQSRKILEKKHGKAAWYRYGMAIEINNQAAVKTASKNDLKTSDKWLALLDRTAEYPLQVKEPVEIEKLKNDWNQAIANAESLRSDFPEDPQVSRRLGVLYRRGFTLDMPGAWERAEAYLLRTTTLAPKSAEAHISLGILYGDTGDGFEKHAESQFRTAFKLARKDQLPYIWWGLAIALHKQGKKSEALKTIGYLIKQRPNDVKALKLREQILRSDS